MEPPQPVQRIRESPPIIQVPLDDEGLLEKGDRLLTLTEQVPHNPEQVQGLSNPLPVLQAPPDVESLNEIRRRLLELPQTMMDGS